MRILALALLCLLAFSQPASADPISALLATLGTAFKAAITIKALAAAALRTLVKVGISLLIGKLTQKKQRQPGLQTTHTTTGGTDPQGSIVGRYATAGHLVYHNSHGPNRRYLTHVIEVGDIPGASLSRIIIDGEYSELGTVEHPDVGFPILSKSSGSTHWAWIRFLDGSQTTADPYLVEAYGSDPARAWSSNHILTGLPHAILTFERNDPVYPQGRPQYRFEIDGPRFYDLRRDSSAGGSGAHRWDDPATWTQTSNAMVIAYTVMRGITLRCGSIWGGGYPAEDLPAAHWILAMDTCDIGVGENLRPQFKIGFEIRFEEEPADFLEELFSSANAEIFELGGYWYPRVGAASGPVVDITDDDLLVSEPLQYNPFPGVEQTFNAVTISHPSPNALWSAATLETISNPQWQADDGGERLFDLKLPMVASPEQCRQIGQSLLNENRQFRSHKGVLPPDYFHLQPLQLLRWTSAWNGYYAKLFQIAQIAYDLLTLTVSVSFRECDPSDFDPDLGLELPDEPRVTTPVDVIDAGVLGFAVQAISLKDAAGVDRSVAILASWSASLVGVADGLTFEARITGSTSGYIPANTSDLAQGQLLIIPVSPGQDYEVHAKAISSSRETAWSAWLPVTTPDVRLGPADLSDQVLEDIALAALVRADHDALIEGFTGENLGGLQVDYDEVQLALASTQEAINREIAATGPSTLGLPLEAWNYGSSPNNSAPGSKAKILGTDLVSGDEDFGDCFQFRDAINANMGPARVYDWVPGVSVFAVTITFKTVDDGTGVSNNTIGATLYQGDVRDSTENNQQANVGDYSVADGVQVKTVWFTDRADVIALGSLDTGWDGVVNLDSPANGNNNGVLFHLRQNSSNAGTALQRIKSIEVRDVAALATALIARNAAAGSELAAGVSETNAAGYVVDANTAWAGAVSARETAVSVSSQGVGVLSNQFLPLDWLNWGIGPTRTANEIYGIGSTFTWEIGAGSNAGVQLQSSSAAWVGSEGAAAYWVEVEFELLTGSADGAGVLFDWRNTSNTLFRVTKLLEEMVSEPITVGQKMLASWVFERPSGYVGPFDFHNVILLANWTGLAPNSDKNIKFHRAYIHPITTTDAAVLEQASVIADMQENASAGYLIQAQAGDEVSLLELIAADGSEGAVSLVRIAAELILLEGSVQVEQITIADHLVISATDSGFQMGKTSTTDPADGIYMGRTDEGGGVVGFGLYAGRTDASVESALRVTPDGVEIINADFKIGAATQSNGTVTTGQTLTLPPGTETLSLTILAGGSGGQGGGLPGTGALGGPGGNTVIILKDGSTTIETYTATGGGGSTRLSPYTPYGNGGIAGARGAEHDDGWTYGTAGTHGKAGQSLNFIDIDVSSLSNPKLVITIGAAGAGGAGSNGGGSGTAGSSGLVIYTHSGDRLLSARPPATEPSAVGSFTVTAGVAGSFPNLQPRTGIWVLNKVPASWKITVAPGAVMANLPNEGSVTFISKQRPTWDTTHSVGMTIDYMFYPS